MGWVVRLQKLDVGRNFKGLYSGAMDEVDVGGDFPGDDARSDPFGDQFVVAEVVEDDVVVDVSCRDFFSPEHNLIT